MAKRLTEKQKSEIAEYFKNGKTIAALSEEFNCTTFTITRNLKKNLGEMKYKQFVEKNKNFNQLSSQLEIDKNKKNDIELANKTSKNEFRDDLKVEVNKTVYMIVDKNIELEVKLLKDYPEWEFLPNEDLERKTIEIYYDLKLAKRACNKEQKVIKVPNTDVFRIVSPILISRGISRIVSAEKLIAL